MNNSSDKKGRKIASYIIPGIITLLVMVFVLIVKGIWPFGSNRIDLFDNMQQVAPLYAHLWDAMHGNASVWFDWYTGLGTNVSMSISAFSMFSPFNLLLYLCPRDYILEFISILTLVKMFVMSVTMYAFLNRRYKKLTYKTKVIFALAYTFCGYVLLYASCFTPWMDIVALFPLLKPRESLYLSGGARLDGKAYLSSLKKRAQKRGVQFYSERATIARALDKWQVIHEGVTEVVDDLVLCPGPALKELLESIGTQVNVKPQKGQLLSFQTDFETKKWPVLFLEGAADIIPFQNGQVLLGATHENEEGWDLSESQEAFESLTEGVKSYLSDTKLIDFPYHYRVGTRAYSSDFSPFFGPHPDFSSLAFASALGSSGLTTGPYIAYLLAQYFNHPEISWDSSNYQKDIKNYINIEKTGN